MAGGTWSQKIQLGREGTAGQHAPGVTIWRGDGGNLEDTREPQLVPERTGKTLPTTRNFTPQLGAALNMAATPLTPEQVVHILEAGVKSVGSGTADGVGSSGSTYEYRQGLSSLNNLKTYTIETGDNEAAEAAEHCFVSDFTFSGERGEAIMMSANWMGRQVSASSFHAGATAPSVTEVMSSGSIFIDAASGNIGSTQIGAGNILNWELNVTTGWKPKFTVDSGELYFQDVVFDKDEFSWELNVTYVHDDTARNELSAYRNNEPRLVRLDFAGADYSASGTGTVFGGKKGIRIDTPGLYTDFTALEGEDGISTVQATITGGYDETSDEVPSILVANESDSVPG